MSVEHIDHAERELVRVTLRRSNIIELTSLAYTLKHQGHDRAAYLVSWAVDRLNRQGPKRGEANPGAKLTEALVIEIRRNAEHLTSGQLARKYNMSSSAIRHIRQRRSWKHLP